MRQIRTGICTKLNRAVSHGRAACAFACSFSLVAAIALSSPIHAHAPKDLDKDLDGFWQEIPPSGTTDTGCGVWKWEVGSPSANSELALTGIDRDWWPAYLAHATNHHEWGVRDGSVLIAHCRLSNVGIPPLLTQYLPGSSVGPVTSATGGNRYGLLSYTPPTSGVGVPKLMQFEVRGTVSVRITLHRGMTFAGLSSGTASAAGSALLQMVGTMPSHKFQKLILPRPVGQGDASARVAGATWATASQTTALGFGVTVGVGSTGANWNWQLEAGGDLASIFIQERQVCVDVDCVAPPGSEAEFIMDQVSDVATMNGLSNGSYSEALAKCGHEIFTWRIRPGCKACVPARPLVAPGLIGEGLTGEGL